MGGLSPRVTCVARWRILITGREKLEAAKTQECWMVESRQSLDFPKKRSLVFFAHPLEVHMFHSNQLACVIIPCAIDNAEGTFTDAHRWMIVSSESGRYFTALVRSEKNAGPYNTFAS
jgi:hypothetical protein